MRDGCSHGKTVYVRAPPIEWCGRSTGDWNGRRNGPARHGNPRNGQTPGTYLRLLNEAVLESSDEFFAYETPTDFSLEGKLLRFTSAVETPYPENNRVHGQWFPARAQAGIAARGGAGAAALERIGDPAHGAVRGDGEAGHFGAAPEPAVSRLPHAGRTAARRLRGFGQRRAHHRRDAAGGDRYAESVDWLLAEGYESVGIVGTSLGSCYAFLASVHDPRLK